MPKTREKKPKCYHVTFAPEANTLQCLHCGQKQPISVPCHVEFFATVASAFGKSHARCVAPGDCMCKTCVEWRLRASQYGRTKV